MANDGTTKGNSGNGTTGTNGQGTTSGAPSKKKNHTQGKKDYNAVQ